MPIRAEITVEMAATVRPMITEICAPYMQRDSRSRPRLSVPKGWAQDGACRRAPMSTSFMPYGASTSAKSPTNRNTTATTAPMAPRRFSRKSLLRKRQQALGREAALLAACGCTEMACVFMWGSFNAGGLWGRSGRS